MDMTFRDATINTSKGHVASFNSSVISQKFYYSIGRELDGQPDATGLLLSRIDSFISDNQSITLGSLDIGQVESTLTKALAILDTPPMGRTGSRSRLRTSVGQQQETPSQIRSLMPSLRGVKRDNATAPWKQLAELFGNLRSRFAALGRLEGALSMSCLQVHICLGLVNAQPEKTSPDLAASFMDLTECLRELRFSEEANAVAAHAVHHYRRLVEASPSLLPLLALSLGLESKCRRDLYDHDGAYEAISESIEIQRRIPCESTEACNTALLFSLNHASMCLLSLHSYEEALKHAQEAVTTLRNLPISRLGPQSLILAISLRNLSCVLSELEDHQYALRSAQEAVGILFRAISQNGNAIDSDLAAFHSQLAVARSNLRDGRGAVAASQAAVDELRPAAESSEIFKPDLACQLNQLSGYLRETEDYPGAVDKSKEAVEIQRSIASRDPKRHSPNLVMYLDGLSQCHWKLKEHKEALNVANEAFVIHISRSLAENPTLALLLHHQSLYCADLGRFNDARKMSNESIKIQRDLCSVTPASGKHKTMLAEMEKHFSAIKDRDGAYEALNSGKLAWGGSGPPSDVTRADIVRAVLRFMIVISTGVSFIFGSFLLGLAGGSVLLGLAGGAAIVAAELAVARLLSRYNTRL